MDRALSFLALTALTSASAMINAFTTSGRLCAAPMSSGVWPRTLLMFTCARHSRSCRTAAGRSRVAATMSGLRPSAVWALGSDLCSSRSSTVVRLPRTPSMFTFFSAWSPVAPWGGGSAFTAYISAVQPSLSVQPTREFRPRRCDTMSASLLCAAHMRGVLPSLFTCSSRAPQANNCCTRAKWPRSALRVSGVLPLPDATSSTLARPWTSLATASPWPLMQAQVRAVKPSLSFAAMSAFCPRSQEIVEGRHCVAATCRGVAPVSSRASRSARFRTRCCRVTMSSM
mmetsp:Transcript_55394/g.164681  ORF Transcript_55394/g.164681 Transcript_55394/m.164681 type:complete len:285 (-) Transcript_55394:60-914(-)